MFSPLGNITHEIFNSTELSDANPMEIITVSSVKTLEPQANSRESDSDELANSYV